MKNTLLALLSAAVLAAANSNHNHHAHNHLHELHERQDPTPAADVVVPGPTVVVYELNGHFISETDVLEGIKNGSLIYASDGQLSSAPPSTTQAPVTLAPTTSSSPAPAPTTSAAASSVTQADHFVVPQHVSSVSSVSSAAASSAAAAPTTSSAAAAAPTTSSAAAAAPTTSSAAAPAPASSSSISSSSAPAATSASSSSSSSGSSSSAGSSDSSTGVGSDFPDGTIDCSTFPSAYGAVAVDWMNLGGWTGVQTPESFSGGYGNILTATAGTCSNGDCCTEGSFCSYACPAGYQKSQWPSTQGATGQSVGGIQCTNGKLHLTNPSLSSKLCIPGASEVTIKVENTLGQNVAVCRTDYPGTEGMTIPTNAQAGQTLDLTCPDASNYYHWQGGSTSAQYYVNPAGVSVENACQWGSASNPWGNFAPMNLGVGYSNGAAWLSIFQNAPTTDAKLDFSVEIKGDSLSGSCKYSNGQYCSGSSCSSTAGCTVSLTSGTATFVFS